MFDSKSENRDRAIEAVRVRVRVRLSWVRRGSDVLRKERLEVCQWLHSNKGKRRADFHG